MLIRGWLGRAREREVERGDRIVGKGRNECVFGSQNESKSNERRRSVEVEGERERRERMSKQNRL